jgi:RimJ/RimL family protein N-acetyltransferase
VYGDTAAIRWVGDGEPLDEAQCRQWLEVTASNYRKRGYGLFAVVERSSNEVVGFCGLVHPGGQPEPEIKYAFKPRHWNRGYATEAVRSVLRYGAAEHGLERIIATVVPDNTASREGAAEGGAAANGSSHERGRQSHSGVQLGSE